MALWHYWRPGEEWLERETEDIRRLNCCSGWKTDRDTEREGEGEWREGRKAEREKYTREKIHKQTDKTTEKPRNTETQNDSQGNTLKDRTGGHRIRLTDKQIDREAQN